MLRLKKIRVCVSVRALDSDKLFRFDGDAVFFMPPCSNYRFRIALYCTVVFTVNVSVPKGLSVKKLDSHVLGLLIRFERFWFRLVQLILEQVLTIPAPSYFRTYESYHRIISQRV